MLFRVSLACCTVIFVPMFISFRMRSIGDSWSLTINDCFSCIHYYAIFHKGTIAGEHVAEIVSLEGQLKFYGIRYGRSVSLPTWGGFFLRGCVPDQSLAGIDVRPYVRPSTKSFPIRMKFGV